MKVAFGVILMLVLFSACATRYQKLDSENPVLQIYKVAPHTYRHVSFLETERFGKVACNGMIVIDQDEAVVIDAPTNDEAAADLLYYVKNDLNAEVKAVVVTHFHEDCLGGLKSFHEKNIPSYAYFLTQELARKNGEEIPQHTFKDSLMLAVGKEKLNVYYLGAGHTADNTVVYFEQDQSLFGGCLVKSLGASKGNLSDARVEDWSTTIEHVEEKFTHVKHVIPGHGKDGGKELLTYTKELFAL
ncbi:metallo-beta-lactamase class B [Lishizhenia tianjinensis]|uniref:beta-lactamase n=1 Tax=Lishizhenia tianjinensis TaxID=477690 RepID=A0A1I6XIU4_9FLAO|nr:subclass B1 metallo-beta-lactamase [Lishizhenia tianjinensis]SFT38230.1 metallo-beta-lactamase class B [Lishizhenia tianjinensis]